MADTVAEVLVDARVLLNDPAGIVYLTAPMVQIVNKAYREMQTKLARRGVSTAKEISSAIDIPAGTVVLAYGGSPALPATLLYPIHLQERPDGSVSEDDYVDMDEEDWEPTTEQTAELRYWTWREESIKFVGATVAREVKIRYMASLAALTATTSPILITNAVTWLGARTAAIAALSLGSNPTRAGVLQGDAIDAWDDFIGIQVNRRQTMPVRRRRTRYRV